MRPIICLAQSKWSHDPERTQHLLRQLPDVELYYFELSVTSNYFDFLRRRRTCTVRKVRPGVRVYHLPVLFFRDEGNTLLERWSLKQTVKAICHYLSRANVTHGLLWCATPLAAPMVELVPHQGLIYDCNRSWERFPERLESQLAYESDLVLAASYNLMEHVAPCNRNRFLVPNGVNLNLFSGAEQGSADPVLSKLPHPLFGYWGDISRQVDLKPLFYVARKNPDWHFVLIGRVRSGHPDAHQLRRMKNIHCIGHRESTEIPGCLAACDACFDLLHNDLADEDVIPERIYAYFALGKPVACLYPMRYVPDFPDVIYGAQTDEEFAQACLKAGNEISVRKKEQRRRYASEADWQDRSALVRQILTDNGQL
jgi:glycosyltransferase involved in cell wall biosynthesis